MISEKTVKNDKTLKIILNIITIIFFNVTFWICNNYPKHIIEFTPHFVVKSVIAILLNCIFYILFFFFLSVCFVKNKSLLSKHALYDSTQSIKQQYHLKKIIICFLIQLVLDILRLTLCWFANIYSLIITDIFIAINWVLIYYVLQKDQEFSIFKNKKCVKIFGAVVISVTILCVMFDLKDIADFNFLFRKFDESSGNIMQTLRNKDYISSIRMLIFDTVLGIITYIIHSMKIPQK